MSLFDVSERAVLDLLFGSGSPASYQLGLSTSAPTDAGTLNEVTGGSYARVTMTNNTTNFPAATTTAGVTRKKNGASFTFPTASGAPWGTITHWFIYDSVNSRAMLWGVLSVPVVVAVGETVRFNADGLDLTLD